MYVASGDVVFLTCDMSVRTKKRQALETVDDRPTKKARANALAVSKVLDKRYALKSDIETKYFQLNFPTTAFGVAGGTSTSWVNAIGSSLFIPVLGDDIMMRQGRQVEVFKINIHGMIDCPADTTNTLGVAPFVRIIVADCIQAKGDTPLPAELMTSNGVFAFQNADNFGQWRVLKDKIVQMPFMPSSESSAVAGSFLNEGYTKHFKIMHKFKKPLKVKFSNIDGEVSGAVSEHNLICVAMASNVLNNPRLTFQCRTSYKDA